MLISEFVVATGLSRDTVRYYVRLGLLQPVANGKGGRNPYQFFTIEDLRASEVIRVGQSLGLSLKDIAALDTERRAQGIEGVRLIEVLNQQLAQLDLKAAELDAMRRYLRAKIDWVRAGEPGSHPAFQPCGCGGVSAAP